MKRVVAQVGVRAASLRRLLADARDARTQAGKAGGRDRTGDILPANRSQNTPPMGDTA